MVYLSFLFALMHFCRIFLSNTRNKNYPAILQTTCMMKDTPKHSIIKLCDMNMKKKKYTNHRVVTYWRHFSH